MNIAPAFWKGCSAEVAEQSGLTVYDAAYLEVVSRRKLSLVALDKKLEIATRWKSKPTPRVTHLIVEE